MFNRFTRRILGTTPMQAAIDRVTTELGIVPESLAPDRAAFKLSFHGHSYVTVMEQFDRRIGLIVCSNAIFPLRQIPAGIQEFLDDRNRELPKSDWKICHDSSTSWLIVITFCPIGAMNGRTFRSAAVMLMEEVSAMDATLRRLGLA